MNDLDDTRRRLRRFAAHEAAGQSPLYEHLALEAAEDDDVAGLLCNAAPQDAHPTLLFAVAHRLVQADPIHPLSQYYPSLGGFDGVDRQTWPLFRQFLLERFDAARELMATRFTQTNEVRRAAVLYPAVARVAGQVRGPVGLLEVGCSAGLLLGMDRFAYHYQLQGGEQLVAGPAKAPVGLHCALSLEEGAVLPTLPKKLSIEAKVGLDRAPVDISDEDELAWLEACVWADQPDRARLLRTAAAAQSKDPPRLMAGDAVNDVTAAAQEIPEHLPLIVLTSHVLAYLTPQRRDDFIAALGDIAAQRPLWWVSEETYEAALRHVRPDADEPMPDASEQVVLAVMRWQDETVGSEWLATAAAHGQRMTWFAHT